MFMFSLLRLSDELLTEYNWWSIIEVVERLLLSQLKSVLTKWVRWISQFHKKNPTWGGFENGRTTQNTEVKIVSSSKIAPPQTGPMGSKCMWACHGLKEITTVEFSSPDFATRTQSLADVNQQYDWNHYFGLGPIPNWNPNWLILSVSTMYNRYQNFIAKKKCCYW